MAKRIAVVLAVLGCLLGIAAGAASAGQFPTAYMFCDTPAGSGPVLIRPAFWAGRSCYVIFPGFGRSYGTWILTE